MILYFPLVVATCTADMQRMTTSESMGAWPTVAVAVAVVGLVIYSYGLKLIDR